MKTVFTGAATNMFYEPRCFKNPENPSYIDLILTNKKFY